MADSTQQSQQTQSAAAASPAVAEPDLVTQLQTCLDQLATQYYASLRYVSTRHPMSAPIDPFSLPPPQSQARSQQAAASASTTSTTPNGAPSSQSLSQSQSQSQSLPPTQSTAPTSTTTSTSQPAPQTRTPYPPFVEPTHDPKPDADADADGAPATEPVSPSHAPVAVPEFRAAIRELAQDLVLKQKQIEGLIGRLPDAVGDGAERERQERRLAELGVELEEWRGQVGVAREKRERLLGKVDGVIAEWGKGRV